MLGKFTLDGTAAMARVERVRLAPGLRERLIAASAEVLSSDRSRCAWTVHAYIMGGCEDALTARAFQQLRAVRDAATSEA